MPDVVQVVVWSDYLCPWCRLGAVRLRRLADEFGARVRITWRAYLLRPDADPQRTLDDFRSYTLSWRRPASEPDAPPFEVWASDEGPPSHSVPPQLAAKAAATLGDDAFARLHARFFDAYFAESRDITNPDVIAALWAEVGLPPAELARAGDPAVLRTVVDEHDDAVRRGINGVPTVMLAHDQVAVPGALPYETYRRWIDRALAG